MMTRYPISRKSRGILVIMLVLFLLSPVTAASGDNSLTVVVRDRGTWTALDTAMIYIDGGYAGSGSSAGTAGTLVLPAITAGRHTIRVTSPGYQEATTEFVFPNESLVTIYLKKEKLVSLNPNGISPNAIDIVYYPSSVSYNCTTHTRVSTPLYFLNETQFRNDVVRDIDTTFRNLNTITDPSEPLPDNYRSRFNFYYYYDPALPANAFFGCAGSLPESFRSEVPFSDVTIVLYPVYYGVYADTSCEMTGCTEFGPGYNQMKIPASLPVLGTHEAGHAVFGLIDTYCGDTYYMQNDPHPNVWASLNSCKADAVSHYRDPGQCRQIQNGGQGGSASCVKDYWKWDLAPDIMNSGYSGRFGGTSTERINYILSTAGGRSP